MPHPPHPHPVHPSRASSSISLPPSPSSTSPPPPSTPPPFTRSSLPRTRPRTSSLPHNIDQQQQQPLFSWPTLPWPSSMASLTSPSSTTTSTSIFSSSPSFSSAGLTAAPSLSAFSFDSAALLNWANTIFDGGGTERRASSNNGNNNGEERKGGSCGHSHPFDFLSGDIVLVPGFYGSILRHRTTNARAWINWESALSSWGHVDIGYKLSDSNIMRDDDDEFVVDGVLESVGPFDICSGLVSELRRLEKCKNGELRFHEFAYDWRRDLQGTADEFERFLDKIVSRGGAAGKENRKVTVIAHSMGGLVTLRTCNARPELFRGVVFVGTPFVDVPMVVWAFRRGAPLLPNTQLFGSRLHFLCRSAYTFLPKDSSCLLDADGNEISIDFLDPRSWFDYSLSPMIRDARTDEERDRLRTYVGDVLARSQRFRDALKFDPKKTYPPFAVVQSDRWSTAVGFRASVVDRILVEDSPTSAFVTNLQAHTEALAGQIRHHTRRISKTVTTILFPGTSSGEEDNDDGDSRQSTTVKTTTTSATGKSSATTSTTTTTTTATTTATSASSPQRQRSMTLETPVVAPSSPPPLNESPSTSAQPQPQPRTQTPELPRVVKELRLHMPVKFAPGDGVVSAASAMMPDGYDYKLVPSEASHIPILNDLQSLKEALLHIEAVQRYDA